MATSLPTGQGDTGSIPGFVMGFIFSGQLLYGMYVLDVSVFNCLDEVLSYVVLGGGPCTQLITGQGIPFNYVYVIKSGQYKFQSFDPAITGIKGS